MSKPFSFAAAALCSLVLLAGLGFLVYRETSRPSAHSGQKPLLVYCAAALKPAMQTIAAEYERETGTPIEFRFGNSEQVLANATLSQEGDLFLPADDSFVQAARRTGMIVEAFPFARMKAVVLTQAGNPRGIARFADLLNPDLRLGQANPDAAAIGKVTREHLERQKKWKEIAANTRVQLTTVTDVANAVLVGSVDAAIVWDAVAANYPSLAVVHLPELDGAVGKVELAVLRWTADQGASERFARFVRSPNRGQPVFRTAGFTDFLPGPEWKK